MTISFSSPHCGRLARLALVAVLLAGCNITPGRSDRPDNPFKTAQEGPGARSPLSDQELRQQAEELYRHARQALINAEYSDAIKRYDTLIARYPFSDFSTQAELEKMYAEYKSFQWDEATIAADRFLRAHPRYPSADYVMYLKGVADFSRDQGLFETLLPNNAKRDIGNQVRSYEDFALLVKRYPDSRYVGDARRRMLYSRNRIANHELSVAQFYFSRGAYVAAAKRATDIISDYPGAPATAEALKILQRSYASLGLTQEAKDAATVIAMSSNQVQYTDAPKPGVVTKQPDPYMEIRRPKSSSSGWHSKTRRAKTQQAPAGGGSPAPTAPSTPAAPTAPTTKDAPATSSGPTSRLENAPARIMVAEAAPQPAYVLVAEGVSQDDSGGGAASVTAASSESANAAADANPANTTPEKPGLMTRFANLFSSLDTTKPENQHVFVIGGSKTAATTVADSSPAAPFGNAPSDNAAAPSPPSAATPTKTAPAKSSGFTLRYGGTEDATSPRPEGN